MSGKHKCAISNCTVEIGADYLMCGRHWRLVPVHLSHLAYEAYHKWQLDELSLDRLREVQARAIQAVENALGNPLQGRNP